MCAKAAQQFVRKSGAEMEKTMKREEAELLEQLQYALQAPPIPSDGFFCLQEPEEMLALAREHAVMPLLYHLCEVPGNLTDAQRTAIQTAAKTAVRTNYRLLFVTKFVTEYLREHGICAIVLKGVATASYYPVPELRKSGDVDLLIPGEADFARAIELLRQADFEPCEKQDALHHLELKNKEGICVEVHRILAEPFESKKVNAYLESLLPEYGREVAENDAWGFPFCQPADGCHAFYLILHMLQHFLRAGFGLKFLCDWVVFWNRPVEEPQKQTFLRLVEGSRTGGFVGIMTAACVRYLGLPGERVAFILETYPADGEVEAFMEEIFGAGEFGHVRENRMVAMRTGGILSYAREFHHQMHLNYPRAGKIFLLWPALWCATLARFLYNNHAVRGVKSTEILREAGKRSRLVEKMKLFSP